MSGRLTYQLLSNSKLSAYFDRAFKNKGHSPSATDDPASYASYRPWRTHMYYTSSAKLTTTLSSRLLLEAGYSGVLENRVTTSQPGIDQPRGTPEWFANATHYDFVTDRNWGSRGVSQATEERFLISSAVSYVTGSHNLKTGFQWFFGPDGNSRTHQAGLLQRYRNGVPENVDVYNTPRYDQTNLNADLGIFVQDSWTIDRLTLNPGVRLENLDATLAETFMAAGRFLPARIAAAASPIPAWWDISPRFSAVYDLFGDARTALKVSANKYTRPVIEEMTRRYSPVFSASDRRDWFDVDLIPGTSTPSGIVKATDGDDIAQDSEIGVSNLADFGLPSARTLDDNFEREYNWELQCQPPARGVAGRLGDGRLVSAVVPRPVGDTGPPPRTVGLHRLRDAEPHRRDAGHGLQPRPGLAHGVERPGHELGPQLPGVQRVRGELLGSAAERRRLVRGHHDRAGGL